MATKNESDLKVAAALIADSIHALGHNKAGTDMGAIEAHTVEMNKQLNSLASCLDGIGNAIEDLAVAVEKSTNNLADKLSKSIDGLAAAIAGAKQ